MNATWMLDSVELRRNLVFLIYGLVLGGIIVYTVRPLVGWIAQAAVAVPLSAHQLMVSDRMALSPGSASIHPKYSRRRTAIATRVLLPPVPGRSRELFWYRTLVLSMAGLSLIHVALVAVFGWEWVWAPYVDK